MSNQFESRTFSSAREDLSKEISILNYSNEGNVINVDLLNKNVEKKKHKRNNIDK